MNRKSQYHSLEGRLTPISNVLEFTPVYIMFLLPISNGVIDSLDSMRRNFMWEGNSETRKFYLVKWDTLFKSKRAGGSGQGKSSFDAS